MTEPVTVKGRVPVIAEHDCGLWYIHDGNPDPAKVCYLNKEGEWTPRMTSYVGSEAAQAHIDANRDQPPAVPTDVLWLKDDAPVAEFVDNITPEVRECEIDLASLSEIPSPYANPCAGLIATSFPTAPDVDSVTEAALNCINSASIDCSHQSRQHIWNAHQQCQWCHCSKERYEAAVVAAAYFAKSGLRGRESDQPQEPQPALPRLKQATQQPTPQTPGPIRDFDAWLCGYQRALTPDECTLARDAFLAGAGTAERRLFQILASEGLRLVGTPAASRATSQANGAVVS